MIASLPPSSPAMTLAFLRLERYGDQRRRAACASLPARSIFAETLKEAAPVLRACNQCPIRKECETVVDPAHTWFDGVSGGRLWRNGRAVEETE